MVGFSALGPFFRLLRPLLFGFLLGFLLGGFFLSGCDSALQEDGGKTWQSLLLRSSAGMTALFDGGSADLWFVGGEDRGSSAIYHDDGKALSRVDSPAKGTLYALHGAKGASVVVGGEGGQVYWYPYAKKRWIQLEGLPQSMTVRALFLHEGRWLYAAGEGGGQALLYEMDLQHGDAFSAIEDPAFLAYGAFYSLGLNGRGELFLLGDQRELLYGQKGAFQTIGHEAMTQPRTLRVEGEKLYVFGGLTKAELFRWDGQQFLDESPGDLPYLTNGCWTRDGALWTVGSQGSIYERKGTVWRMPKALPPSSTQYQDIAVDNAGRIWALGGRSGVSRPRDGVILFYGEKKEPYDASL